MVFLKILIGLAALMTLVSLGVGLMNTLGPKPNAKKQNQMMQWRVFFQFMAFLLLGALFFLSR